MDRIAAVVNGEGEVLIQDQPVPALQEGEALVKVRTSLLSPGTELALIRGRRQTPDPAAEPITFGYGGAGDVVEIKGERAGLEVGMRVAIMGAGYAVHGTYACVPVNLIAPLPDAVSYADAAYTCLAATALQSVRRTVPQLGEYGAVLGLGIVGNLAAQLYQISGARVIGWEAQPNRIEKAARCGLRTSCAVGDEDPVEATRHFAPQGLDFANIAFGGQADEAFEQVMSCMKVSADTHPMGRIVLVGGCHVNLGGGAYSGNVDVRASSRTGPGYKDTDYEHGCDYPAAFVPFTTHQNMTELIKLMAEERLIVSPMTTHALPLTGLPPLVDTLLADPGAALGVVFTMPA
jgi:threonine dehydrogenase-like Zn-dependent dehydrogenase